MGQRRDQYQEGDDGQILEQQHGDGQTAVLQVELALFRQLFRHDGGGGHGEGTAQHDGYRDRGAEQPGHGRGAKGGEQYLHAAEQEHRAAHDQELGQGKFEAQGEQQEHHAELGEIAGVGGIRDPAKTVRTHQQTGEQIGDDRGQFHPPQGGHHQHRHCQQDQDRTQGGVFHAATRKAEKAPQAS